MKRTLAMFRAEIAAATAARPSLLRQEGRGQQRAR